jgi:hypothetical protein
MREYDRASPLIVLHIPKAAGTSVKAVFRKWFGDGLREHYFNERTGSSPRRLDLGLLHSTNRPVAVYGHFNRLRGSAVEQYYPDVQQFITILRDPFERAISNYYYVRDNSAHWKDQTRVPKNDLRQFLIETQSNILHHFPRPVTKDNYRAQIEEFFIEIGLVEHLPESVRRIAAKLRMPFEQEWLPHVNATPRDQPHPRDLREEFAERHALEYEVYDYVASKFAQQANADVAQPRVPADGSAGPTPGRPRS